MRFPAFLGALVVFIMVLFSDGARTKGHYLSLIILPLFVYIIIYIIIKKREEIHEEYSDKSIPQNESNNVINTKTRKQMNISTVANYKGFYGANCKKVVRGVTQKSFICIFFVEDYIFQELILVDDDVVVDQEFIEAISETVEEIADELSTDSLDFDKYKHNLSEYEIKDNTLVAEFPEGVRDTIRLILFFNLLHQDLRMNVEIEGVHFDIYDPSKTGFKTAPVLENVKLNYYEF
jgi:Ca2+/Na+ antiporter